MAMADQPRHVDRILCLVCGRWFRALPTHLRRTHGIGDDDYRLRFGLPAGLPLVCGEWSENQSRRNVERDAARTLTADGPPPGFQQRPSVRANRSGDYLRLAAAGTEAAARIDKTAGRRANLAPYPVTAAVAAERLGCSRSAAYTFLAYCVATGRLRRVGRGLYGESNDAR